MIMFGTIIFVIWVRANSSHYIIARFPGDQYKLYYQQLRPTEWLA